MGVMPSPITGSAGNVEFLAPCPDTDRLGTARPDAPGPDVQAMVDDAVAEAHDLEPED